ncbi:MAG TPA: CBS domain-containing protein [Magnetospirillaceae bacterium]|nr:CBS domain-containing protein [Magnetospirillaceae bacterium]
MDTIPINTDTGPQVILELIYRLKVKDVMTPDPVTAAPGDSLRSIQEAMRDRGFSGVPVVEGSRLLGIVSIGDILSALDGGWIGDRAEDRMTRSVIVLEDDMPLTFAITYHQRYRYGRFPVMDRSGRLVGILTPTDIIRSLLVEMNREVERLESRLKESTEPPEGDTLQMVFSTVRFDFENAGRASAAIKKALKDREADPAVIRRVAIASYELELNQVIHSVGGTIRFDLEPGRIVVSAEDRGPGIADVDMAMREGFSTADEWIRSLGFGAGMGLPNARRSADEFSIESSSGRGTCVRVGFSWKVNRS